MLYKAIILQFPTILSKSLINLPTEKNERMSITESDV